MHAPTSQRPAIVFDLDGTLVDTAPDLTAAMNHVLGLYGRPAVPLQDVRRMVGQGARALISRGMAATGEPVDEAELDRLFHVFLDYYLANIADESRPFEGAIALIERCRDEGYGLGICTNKPEDASRILLEALDIAHYFEALVAGDTLAVRKPDPEPLLETIRRLGGNPARAVMVGDSINDIETARAAGVPVIGVTFGYTSTPMSALAPDVLIDSLDELWPALERLIARA